MSQKIVNILLLGETGIGKSTFINALGNYLTYNTLDEATSKSLLYSVPTKFSIIDDNFTEHEIVIGSSSNELTQPGASSTQNPKTYMFNLNDGNTALRIIDTPGLGDTRGMKYDEWNTEKLLSFISELDYLHAICIMLKPNNSRFSVLFDYCMTQILLRLDMKIKNNICFLFTNARSSFFTPGDTYVPLQQLLHNVETGSLKTKIPFEASNIFCVDNESFRYLAARFSGMQFNKEVTQIYRDSWEKSAASIKRMINYCINLAPVPMQGIVSINESRRIILRLAKPVVDLMVLYEKSLVRLAEHEQDLENSKGDIESLKARLYVPKMETFLVEESITTDTHHEQSVNVGIGLTAKAPYIQRLDLDYKYDDRNTTHSEKNMSSREVIVRDPAIDALLTKEKDTSKVLRKEIEKLKALAEEYQTEAKTVLGIVAKFTVFLKENAMISNNDPFQEYLETIIQEETVGGGKQRVIQGLQSLLNRYKVKKNSTSGVLPRDITDAMGELISLKNSGYTFKEIMDQKFTFSDQLQIAYN